MSTRFKTVEKSVTARQTDYLFYNIVLPNLTYGLSLYGASGTDLNIFQQFLDRCHNLRLIFAP